MSEATGSQFNEHLKASAEPEDRLVEQATRIYTSALVQRIKGLCNKDVASLIAIPDEKDGVVILEKVVRTATRITKYQREVRDMSIARNTGGLIQELVKEHFLDKECLEVQNPAARQLVFTIIGWTTMLYTPKPDLSSLELRIIPDGVTCITETTTPVEVASRSMLQLLCRFGEMLPGKENPPAQQSEVDDLLTCSSLCAASLYKTSGITIKWVMSCGAHLDFDHKEKKLSVFCMPSFCKIHCKDGTALEQ